jgi:hypothetical protein
MGKKRMSGPDDMIVVDARLETPFRAPEVASFVKASRTVIQIETDATPIKIDFHRYVALMEDATYSPNRLGVLGKDKATVVSAHPFNIGLPLDGMAFGFSEKILENRKIRLHYPRPNIHVKGAAICLYYAKGSAVFLRDILLGAFRARRMLGTGLPILVPNDLNDRQRAFLEVIGIGDKDLIPVPASGTVTVSKAFIPSRSFARDVKVKVGPNWRNLRFLMEPEDTGAFNKTMQDRHGGGPKRRLYISRADASGRRILNENVIVDRLKRLGFERLVLAEMSVPEIVSAFANAEIILSPHGSGLTNILFSPPGAQVIEIDHPRSDFVAHGLSRALGQGFHIVGKVPDSARERASQVSQSPNPDEVVRVVKGAIDRLGPETV